ncbi:hypothetical protein evm_001290 [Chilo suppressalis]|nr:hypothetical protein evm_001290 [Chilo suppressalis]
MGLYKLFSCNVEIQYKSCLLSKAMLFTLVTTLLTIILPFLIAYRSRGFWLRTHSYYEQPSVRFAYEYLLVAETNDPSQPIVCGEAAALNQEFVNGEENCVQIQAQEHDFNEDGKNDALELKFILKVPQEKTISSVLVILALDFQLKTTCPLHMQSLAFIRESFILPPTGLKHYGDIEFYQITDLPCVRNIIDIIYNNSLMSYSKRSSENIVEFIMTNYFQRQFTTLVKTLYLNGYSGHTGHLKIDLHLRIPEMEVKYTPNFLQELKWAWPQYLSLAFIFYWIFNRIKMFVFNHRLLMAWKVVPWKKH